MSMEKTRYCTCGDIIVGNGIDRRGVVNKNICWVCDMQENPDGY